MFVAVYGDFTKHDIRVKLLAGKGTEQFRFQNTLRDAGYDCNLYYFTEDDLKEVNAGDQ